MYASKPCSFFATSVSCPGAATPNAITARASEQTRIVLATTGHLNLLLRIMPRNLLFPVKIRRHFIAFSPNDKEFHQANFIPAALSSLLFKFCGPVQHDREGLG